MEKDIEQIMLKEKEERLRISRVPPKTKELFLAIAKEDFCDDYGMTLKAILDGYMQFKVFFENMDMKLDQIISAQQIKKEEKPTGSKLMSGRIVSKGGEE